MLGAIPIERLNVLFVCELLVMVTFISTLQSEYISFHLRKSYAILNLRISDPFERGIRAITPLENVYAIFR